VQASEALQAGQGRRLKAAKVSVPVDGPLQVQLLWVGWAAGQHLVGEGWLGCGGGAATTQQQPLPADGTLQVQLLCGGEASGGVRAGGRIGPAAVCTHFRTSQQAHCPPTSSLPPTCPPPATLTSRCCQASTAQVFGRGACVCITDQSRTPSNSCSIPSHVRVCPAAAAAQGNNSAASPVHPMLRACRQARSDGGGGSGC